MRKMRKSKCKHCVDGVVFNADCSAVINHCFCDIENDDMADYCREGYCSYYERKQESEVK